MAIVDARSSPGVDVRETEKYCVSDRHMHKMIYASYSACAS